MNQKNLYLVLNWLNHFSINKVRYIYKERSDQIWIVDQSGNLLQAHTNDPISERVDLYLSEGSKNKILNVSTSLDQSFVQERLHWLALRNNGIIEHNQLVDLSILNPTTEIASQTPPPNKPIKFSTPDLLQSDNTDSTIVSLFEHAYFEGKSLSISNSMPELTDFDMKMSSFKIAEGYVIEFYTEPFFAGDKYTRTSKSNDSEFSQDLNDKIRSVLIKKDGVQLELPQSWFKHTQKFSPDLLNADAKNYLGTLEKSGAREFVCRFEMEMSGEMKTAHGFVQFIGEDQYKCTGGNEITVRDSAGSRPMESKVNQFEWLSLYSTTQNQEKVKAFSDIDAQLCSLTSSSGMHGAGFINDKGQCESHPEVYWSNNKHWLVSLNHDSYSYK